MISLVSGSSGFIGKHLVKRLAHLGHKVIPISYKQELPKVDEIDYFFHLAGYGNHSNQLEYEDILDSNVNFLWKIVHTYPHTKRFIYVSTSSIYGFKEEPMKEEMVPHPVTEYALTKTIGEYISAFVFKEHVRIIRPFSVYGPGEAEFRFIPTVIQAILKRRQFPLVPDPVHDWIYIDDFLDGLFFAFKGEKQIVNIGTGRETSNADIVKTLGALCGAPPLVTISEPMRSYDSLHWCADNSLLKSMGWQQQHSLVEGLRKTILYYVAN